MRNQKMRGSNSPSLKKNTIMNGIGAANVFGFTADMAKMTLNNVMAERREALARQENFQYNEKAAENADKRTRSLYGDLYSPQAQLEQLKDAGLSPSLMYGNGTGSSGQAGAQGAGVSGISPTIFGLSPLEAAQTALTLAQKNNVEADTEGKRTDNKIKEIAKSFKEIEFDLYHINYEALSEYVVKNGQRMSLYEFAGECTSYENFIDQLRKMHAADSLTNTEQGQQALRNIYIAKFRYSRDIATLSEEETSANFEMAVVNALKSKDFANLNAESAIAYLKQNIATNELTESQKDAWNNLLNSIGDKSSTAKDIAIILGMIINNFTHNMHYTNVTKSYNITK